MIHQEDVKETGDGVLPVKPRRRRNRSRSRSGSSLRGKFALLAIFLILRGLDAFTYFEWPSNEKSALFGSIVNSLAWTTGLTIAVWFRKEWARYVLIIFLPLGVLSGLILLPDFWIKFEADNRLLTLITVSLIVNSVVAWFLMFSRDLDRLTGHEKS